MRMGSVVQFLARKKVFDKMYERTIFTGNAMIGEWHACGAACGAVLKMRKWTGMMTWNHADSILPNIA